MDRKQSVAALGALAHEIRLELFRLLVQKGPEGLTAGTLAASVGIAPSSLTFHLQQLTHAGLIAQRRTGRNLIYSTDYSAMNSLMSYLTENCCGQGIILAPICNPGAASGTQSCCGPDGISAA
jgi:DNA-binding transcriptional ArsR family regulator